MRCLCASRLHPECTEDALTAAVSSLTTEEQRRQRNGGLALPVLLEARERLDERLPCDCCDMVTLSTIEMRDIEAALLAVPRE